MRQNIVKSEVNLWPFGCVEEYFVQAIGKDRFNHAIAKSAEHLQDRIYLSLESDSFFEFVLVSSSHFVKSSTSEIQIQFALKRFPQLHQHSALASIISEPLFVHHPWLLVVGEASIVGTRFVAFL